MFEKQTLGIEAKTMRLPGLAGRLLKSVFTLVAAAWLAGCATVAHKPMTAESSAKLTAKKVAVVNYEPADFVPFTADKAAFGMIGAALMIQAGKDMVTKYELTDPAVAVREQLMQKVAERRGASVAVVESTKLVSKDDIPALVAAYPGAEYLLDVKTFGNQMTYYPTNWVGYRYIYSARVRVIETTTKEVVAETLCSTVQGDDAKPPSFDQMTADQAALLKSYMRQAATKCAEIVAKDLLQLQT
jgi:hypothetical protein